jgi:hypothetical protein
MRIGFRRPADLAKEIGNIWASRNRVAYTWPFNRFKWDTSDTWWVVPASDRVAFQYAKIIVSSSLRVAPPDHLFVGLYVEKGVGKALADAGYYTPDWVLGPTWRWHGIIEDLSCGRFSGSISDASRRLGESIDIKLDAHVPTRSAAIKPPHDILWFESSDGSGITHSVDPILKTPQGFLRQSSVVATLPELATALRSIPAADSAWIDMCIGRSMRKSDLHNTSALDALQLTDRLLEPFAKWVE